MEYHTDYRDYYKNQSYYDVLGVKKDASLENIQKAKDRLKFGGPDDRAPFSMWDKIDEAFKVLSDVDKRKEYDKTLAENENSNGANVPASNDIVEEISKQIEKQYDSAPVESTPIEEETTSKVSEEKTQDETVISNPSEEETTSKITDNVEEISSKEKEYDLKFISEFNPKEKTKKSNLNAKNITITVAGTLIPFAGAALLGAPALGLVAATAANFALRKKHKKVSLQKGDKSKKITKITTAEMGEIEKYTQTLNSEINRLLSEPHNNYKLEINRVKYENQIALLEKLLDIKLSKNVKKTEMLKYKLDVVSTKMQLETSKKYLANIKEKIKEYEKEQGLSKVNKELIEVNQKLAEQKGEKSFSLRKLDAYKIRLLNKRDSEANRVKFMVEKSSRVYDSFLKAKDFIKSLPYAFKTTEKIDEFMSDELQKNR